MNHPHTHLAHRALSRARLALLAHPHTHRAPTTLPTLATLPALVLALALATLSTAADAASAFTPYPAARITKTASVPGAETRVALANEPNATAGIMLEFDLPASAPASTPYARLNLGDLVKIPVKRPGQSAVAARGALHVLTVAPDGAETLAGSLPVKPGATNKNCIIDITDAINAALAAPPATAKKIRLAVRVTGAPLPYEVYALAADTPPVLELASPQNWTDDWRERLAPLTDGPLIYREACLALADTRDAEIVLPLLYPAKKIIEAIHLGTGEKLREGADWLLRDGKLILPPGTAAPVQLADEFFLSERKDKQGNITKVRGQIKLKEGGWYHERQLEVTYEPAARDWRWPAALSGIDALPRTQKLLTAKAPLTIIVFGDSISAGYNSSRTDGLWPYQQPYGELVARALRRAYGAPVTLMNHARAGGTSGHAATQADAQVAWFKPDLVLLAFGMNERNEARRAAHRANMEKIIDIVRARSPETEFVIITPMLNNPAQPTGLDPVKYIRDEALKIRRPGIAHVDLTSTELALLERKTYLDLSGNGANHPNDFLHRIYAMRVLEVLLPKNTP
ncbi:MAG: SGNH/GDSL hydrolase family protein [Opitutaceae bacterium]|jgi:lysophospholipase L1-like esterase|nr:SGNH/GDSL hydrolase family protein [Opitutaceae bacterium]